jgi:hypothetical protein
VGRVEVLFAEGHVSFVCLLRTHDISEAGGLQTGYPDNFCRFPQFLQVNPGIVP